jgi:sugar lactone lactonase YvrE
MSLPPDPSPRRRSRRLFGVAIGLVALVATACGPGDLSALAGNGAAGATGDGAAAINAELYAPYGTAADSAGDVYIADTDNHRVRKVAADGTITTFAGTGTSGFSGDGGAATSAKLNYPGGVAVDSDGNVYIADTGNARVRKVTTGGFLFLGDGGPATSATLNYPTRLAFDLSGNLLIADSVNHRIRRVTWSDGKINTVAGTGTSGSSGDGAAATSARLSYPTGIAVVTAGNVYVADTNNHKVRRFTIGGTISTFAGTGTLGFAGDGGAATAAQLNYPGGVAVDAAGNVFIADTSNDRVRRVDPTNVITTIAGTGAASSATGVRGPGGALKFALTPGSVSLSVDAKTLYLTSDNVVYTVAEPAKAPAAPTS